MHKNIEQINSIQQRCIKKHVNKPKWPLGSTRTNIGRRKNMSYLLTYKLIPPHFIIRTNINIILHLAAVQPSSLSSLMAAWLPFSKYMTCILNSLLAKKKTERKEIVGLGGLWPVEGISHASASSILEILLLSCTLPMLIACAHAGSERATSPSGWISPLHLDIILPPAMICVSRLEFNSP